MNIDTVILLAEDDNGHATLIKRNLRRSGIINQILHFKDGEKILSYLTGNGGNSEWNDGASFILIADIRMPKVTGTEVLKRIKEHSYLHTIPVIILSTSDDQKIINECRERGCLDYVVKPVDYNQFVLAIKQIGDLIKNLDVPNIHLPV